jgi:hypothetical protein
LRRRNIEENRRKCDPVASYEAPQDPATPILSTGNPEGIKAAGTVNFHQPAQCQSSLHIHRLDSQASSTDVALSHPKLASGPLMTSLFDVALL